MEPQSPRLLYEKLERYAGWLDRERASAVVRADVQALRNALDRHLDPTPLLDALERDLARLPSSDLRNLLRAATAQLRLTSRME